ncbi:MAG TPA: DUF5689 domain-containing protein, partial [Flavisolibacter sp.]|nr:DUF5689 domain-containing protein [Flavisolibacter sp.]
LDGSSSIAAIVVSDHSEGNLPKDLLIVQNNPRLSFLRGLAINIGAAAAVTYLPGDSVHINLVGSQLVRVNGTLQVTNITADKVTKMAVNRPVAANPVTADKILANPGDYESTLLAIVEGGFIPPASPGQVMSGEHQLTDGTGILPVVTDADAHFAAHPKYKMANYYGIVYCNAKSDNSITPTIRPRKSDDIIQLNSVYETPDIIITGWHSDPRGTDANYEYMQFLATRDIDFSATPYAVVTTNNAGASNPAGAPLNGWATGGLRTYKINITSGFAARGTLFYVGGTGKRIDSNDSTSSTDISSANWVATRNYTTTPGNDFGAVTTNLLANSGNAYGVAVFKGTVVDKFSIPVDVLFVATGGTLYAGSDGYRIGNNDLYRIINPLTLQEQPFYRSGTNTANMTYTTPSDAALYNSWKGEYNLTLGRWTKVRTKVIVPLRNAAALAEIENPENIVKLVQ